MLNLLIFIFVFVGSWLAVGLFVKWSEQKSILDVPNKRSSHDTPTPVGGGLVIVLFTLGGFLIFELMSQGTLSFWSIYLGGIAIAGVSWIDDLNPVPSAVRLIVHVAAAGAVMMQLGSFESVGYEGVLSVNLRAAGWIVCLLWIVWMTNAYNFMDGIDGLAGVQAVVAAAGWSVLSLILGLEFVGILGLLIIASVSGFLVYNWPPAKVFMGDVGSAYLGFMFAVMPLIALNSSAVVRPASFLPLAAVGFVWFFATDTILTFLRRLFSGERVWVAHRTHHYQKMVKQGRSHLFVTLIYGTFAAVVTGLVVAEAAASIAWLFIPAGLLLTIAIIFLARGTEDLT